MKRQRLLPGITLGVLVLGRVAIGSVALADDATPSPSPSASPTVEASPSPSPSVSPDPSPTPSPSADPSPSPSAEPSASPEPSADPSPRPHDTGVAQSETGPGTCGGVKPDWVFDTASGSWVAADQSSFSCDMPSGLWLSPQYYFDKRMGWYKIIPASDPKPDYLVTSAPAVVHTALGDLVVGSKDYQVAQALGLLNPDDGIVIGSTGPGSNNSASIDSSNKSWVDLTSLVNVINALQLSSQSGNVNAGSNTTAGNVGSGAANVLANLINLLASAWSWSNGSLNFFMQNIIGNQTGDLTLTPQETATAGGGQLGASSGNNGLQVKAQSSGNIVNNIDALAHSGDASANSNTAVGNVSSGNATAMVNIVNLISSMITSGSSFFGVLNIFGNLNGDVLFPQGFLNGLTPSGNQVSGTSNRTTIDNQTTSAVANNILTGAATGAVNAQSNTQTGALASGNATTTQSLFNLSNTSIFGDNAVLVLVNVLGHWVGKIMTLPGGSSESALLTGNASVNVNGSGGVSAESGTVNEAKVAQSAVGTITNNIGVAAQSGDASASSNTKVGDVTTGDAHAGAGVANIINSVLNVKHWFGVLVINVFGDWIGDVNHDSEAGTSQVLGTGRGGPVSPAVAALAIAGTSLPVHEAITPVQAVTGSGAAPAQVTGNGGSQTRVLAAESAPGGLSNATTSGRDMSLLFGLSAIVLLIAGMLASLDRRFRRR
jgi:hypothetical protein